MAGNQKNSKVEKFREHEEKKYLKKGFHFLKRHLHWNPKAEKMLVGS